MARERRQGRYGHESVEFGRVLVFSDGLFAIALTLLVVSIAVPTISGNDSVGDLADALGDLKSNVISFFISFAVIGRYWVAHYRFFSLLKAMDTGLVGRNLVYLAFIAFLPFPTALFGSYSENPLAVTIYAVNVAIVSGLEIVLFRYAHDKGLIARRLPDDVYRWAMTMSLTPVVVFALSIPIAFLSTTAAAFSWLLTIPILVVGQRWKPARSDELLGA